MDRKCRGIDQAGCPTLSRTGWRQLGGLWFPWSLHVGGWRGGGGWTAAYSGGRAKGVKAGHLLAGWLAVTSAAHLKDGTCNITRTGEWWRHALSAFAHTRADQQEAIFT